MHKKADLPSSNRSISGFIVEKKAISKPESAKNSCKVSDSLPLTQKNQNKTVMFVPNCSKTVPKLKTQVSSFHEIDLHLKNVSYENFLEQNGFCAHTREVVTRVAKGYNQ